MHRHGRVWATALIMTLVLATQHSGSAEQGQAPADVRALLEGTWELEEWHVDGEVLRPPQIGGHWSNHDGIVMATLHRTSGGSFQSASNYGTYQMDATTWSYRYDYAQSVSGPSAEEATVTVRTGQQPRSFEITRRGNAIMLDRPNDHREYEGRCFLFMPNGQLLRKWRKVQ